VVSAKERAPGRPATMPPPGNQYRPKDSNIFGAPDETEAPPKPTSKMTEASLELGGEYPEPPPVGVTNLPPASTQRQAHGHHPTESSLSLGGGYGDPPPVGK